MSLVSLLKIVKGGIRPTAFRVGVRLMLGCIAKKNKICSHHLRVFIPPLWQYTSLPDLRDQPWHWRVAPLAASGETSSSADSKGT